MNTILKLLCLFAFPLILINKTGAQETTRWDLTDDGGIEWFVQANETHMDNIEMSGLYISSIVNYGVQNGRLQQKVHLIFPMLRTIPNDTHASLAHEINYEAINNIRINGNSVNENPERFYIKGILTYQSNTSAGIQIKHRLFPSTDKAIFFDKTEIYNPTNKVISIELTDVDYVYNTKAESGVYGAYQIKVVSDKKGSFIVNPGGSLNYALIYSGHRAGYMEQYVSSDYELNKRKQFINETFSSLVFESPDQILNREFAFAKLRAVESIYETKGGLMHGPGGGRYYAAIWANDQAEYVNPFFPFLGNPEGNESAINAFRHFARYMNPEYKPIPSSIIAEGTDIWNGAGDRGDMAMIAYGASRFALAYGDENTARELWPLIEWCLDYCKRKLNSEGVVSSDSDELEGRFPSGDANLNTSSLYYDALISAVYLGEQLNIEASLLDTYTIQSGELEKSIEAYFGYNVSGYETYRYYEGNDILRAWICTPLTVDIFRRSKGTIDALFSEKLWTDDGLASLSGSTTFWDRATLYALRGVFSAGETLRALTFMTHYSKRRLLGEHVPYPVEAYPEGNQRHLSAESALYCRIVTEGIFGIRPTGFRSFSLSPRLPENWNSMALRNIKAFRQTFDIEVLGEGDLLLIRIFTESSLYSETRIKQGETLNVQL